MNQGCGAPMCTDRGKSYDLNGRFGVFVQLFVDVQAAGGLIDQKALESDFLLLADVTQQGQNATLAVQVCDLVLPPVPVKGQKPLTFILDPALLSSVGTVQASGSLDSTMTCAGLLQPQPLALVLGAKLKLPLTDPLPTSNAMTGAYTACGGSLMACSSAPDPATGGCVCDQEGDSKLGATLGVTNAPGLTDLDKVYVALRATVNLSGQVFSADEIQGTVAATLEQTILGCHRAAGDCNPTDLGIIQGIAPTITQSDATMDTCNTSLFIAKRVPTATDCAALKAMKGTLF